jgi:hypothetical protein
MSSTPSEIRQCPKGLPRNEGGTGDYKGAALIVIEEKKEKGTIKQPFFFWDILRFSIWISVLTFYIFWINTVIQIIPIL